MDEFQFAGQGKFALVAFENVYTGFPHDKDYRHHLSDGTWVFSRIPVGIDSYWKEWIGTIRLSQLENSNLIMIISESSKTPQVLDEHQKDVQGTLLKFVTLYL